MSDLFLVRALRDDDSLSLSIAAVGRILDTIVAIRFVFLMPLRLDAHLVDVCVDSFGGQAFRGSLLIF